MTGCALFAALRVQRASGRREAGVRHRAHLPRSCRPPILGALFKDAIADVDDTLLDEEFRVEDRRTSFENVTEVQKDLDTYLVTYNEKRHPESRAMNGRASIQGFLDGRPKTITSANESPKRQLDPPPTACTSPEVRHCQMTTIAILLNRIGDSLK